MQIDEEFRIRQAKPGDLARVDALLARAYPLLLKSAYPPSLRVLAVPIISRAQPALLACGTYHVAETAAGEIVGAGGWTMRPRSSCGEIRHLVTDPSHLRRGLGGAIVGTSLEEARALGMRQMACKSTLNAVSFYRAMGFATLGPIEVPLGPGIAFPAMEMMRRL